jgi:hypothetical protein
VPLGRPLEAVLADHNAKVARRLRALRGRARLVPVRDDAEATRLSREMIAPFAVARHGEGTTHVSEERVRLLARGPGRLDLLTFDGEPVGCELGVPRVREGRRRWVAVRFGCPPRVFADPDRLAEASTLATYLVMVRALEAGFDAYDIGSSPARPDGGLLQWKRKRGAVLDASLPDGFFWVGLPRPGAARFLWNTPLFALEPGGIVLHLGMPDGVPEGDAAARYREMGYRGLAGVRVHGPGAAPGRLAPRLRELFAGHGRAPEVRAVEAG